LASYFYSWCGALIGIAAELKPQCLWVRVPPSPLVYDVVRELVQRRSLNLRDCGFESRLRHITGLRGEEIRRTFPQVSSLIPQACWCRLVGTELTFIRSVTRFDSGACNLRPEKDIAQCASTSLISSDGQVRLLDPPFIQLVEYANRKSGLVENQVILQVRLLSQPPCLMIAWSSG
jgi:hypothetical protein